MMIWKKHKSKSLNSSTKMLICLLSYSLKCRKNHKSENQKPAKTNKGKPILLPKCAACHSKKLRFIKEQEANRLSRNLKLKVS